MHVYSIFNLQLFLSILSYIIFTYLHMSERSFLHYRRSQRVSFFYRIDVVVVEVVVEEEAELGDEADELQLAVVTLI